MMGPFVVGCAVAGVLYVLIMPHLSTWVALSVMLFGVAFGFSYVYWQPRQNLGKLGGLVPFLALTGIQNEQSYSFADYANSVAMIVLAISIVIVASYIPSSPRPEKEFLRLLGRFFRRAAFLMARLARDGEKKGLTGRWKRVLYRNDLLELSEKLRTLGQQIDHRTLPENTPEQVQALVTSLFGLALWLKELTAAREYPQAEPLVRAVLDDVRAWRLLAETQFKRWADDPAGAVEPGVAMQDRLTARLATMEARIDTMCRLAGDGTLSPEDSEHFYRLLGRDRGLAEAAIDYARLADSFNWAQWQEARF